MENKRYSVNLAKWLISRYIILMEDGGKKNHDRTDVSNQGTVHDGVDSRILNYQKQLRRLASELSLAEARERREIASDLHDHIGQALAYVSQKVTALQGNAIFSGMEEEFSDVLSILNQTIRYTRNLTVEISPPILYELGLPAAIDWLAERTEKRHQLKVKSRQTGTRQPVSENITVFIFKSIQELINNIAKHAQAKKIDIETIWSSDHFEVIVSDNGSGFDTRKLEKGISDNCCFGLFSIRERLSYIGGSLSIESKIGKGTRAIISAPFQIHNRDDHD